MSGHGRFHLKAIGPLAVLLLAACLPRASAGEGSPAGDDLLLKTAAEYVRACCGVPADALPDVRIVDRQEGVPPGRCVPSGETVGGVRYERPTILLRRDASSLPPADLRILLFRETLRCRFEALGPPEDLRPAWEGAREAIERRIDLSAIPAEAQEAATDALTGRLRSFLEQGWIDARVEERFLDEPEAAEALKREVEGLEAHRLDAETFWSQPGMVAVAGRTYPYEPLFPEADPLSGDYECVVGPACHASGSYEEVQPDAYGGIKVYAEYTPYKVEITGSIMTIRRFSSVTTPPRRLEYTTACETCERHPMPWSHSESVATDDMACRLTWNGERGEGACEIMARNSSQVITNVHGGETIPALDLLTTAAATARPLPTGGLELTLPSGTTLLEKKP